MNTVRKIKEIYQDKYYNWEKLAQEHMALFLCIYVDRDMDELHLLIHKEVCRQNDTDWQVSDK